MSRDPRQSAVRWTVSPLVIGACAVWALWPLDGESVPNFTTSTTTSTDEVDSIALDQSAFAAPIWYAPPPEPEPNAEIAKKPRIVPPFELELIAIVHMQGQPTAVFYDPARDAILEVAPGESLSADRSVESIEGITVVVRETTGLRTVKLVQGEP